MVCTTRYCEESQEVTKAATKLIKECDFECKGLFNFSDL